MDYEKLKEVIAKQIKENGRREITGPVLQAVLMAMVDSLGEVYPQTYTDEQKAQARVNIDALSDYDGAITKEKLSAEVQAILNDVANKQNISDATLATIAKTIVGAINELFNGGVKDKSIEIGKLAQAIQDTLKMVGTNVKEVKSGEDLFSLEDGIYSLNGSTYTNYPIGIPFDVSSVCILVVTHSNQRATLYGVDGSHSSPTLPLVAIGDLTNKRWTGGSFYSFFASDYEVGHKLDQKLDNTSSLTDTEVNNIWDNN